MVVKVAEYTGALNCKNCIIVPYSSQSQSSYRNIHCEKHKKPNISHCGSQTISNSLFYQHNDGDNSEQLWHKQFTRWWTWNWQRKRAFLLKKLGKTKPYFHQTNSAPKQKILMKNKSVECNLTANDKIDTKSIKNGQLHQSCDYEHPQIQTKSANEFIPVFDKCSSPIKQPYKSRRRRNKHNERVYEGWMREVNSSDTECTESDVVVKGKSPKNNNRMHYLSLRLRKLNSEFNLNEPSICKEKVTEYKSPISGKSYNLNLSKTKEIHIKPDETTNLTIIPKSCMDKDFLAKPQFECTTQFYKIRNEHFQLLNSICDILNKKQSENKIIADESVNEINETNTSCLVEVNSFNTLNEISSIYMDSEIYKPNISRSLPIFMQHEPTIINKCDRRKSEGDRIDVSNSSEHCYDINYIHNNLDVFKSSITETSFIWDYLQKK